MAIDELTEPKIKRTTFGTGLIKGLAVTLRHLLTPSVTVHYPDERPTLPARSRGVIALKEENCTVCMLCARECPDWCIYIEGHKEERRPAQEGRRAKKYNVLDRFAIDYALCMYCGICVEVCPYDALFWTPEFEYAEHDITELTHEMEKLADWMYTVLPPPPLEEGAMGPEFKTAVAAPAPPPASAAPEAAPAAPRAAPAAPGAAPAAPGAAPPPSAPVPAAPGAAPAPPPPSAAPEAAPSPEPGVPAAESVPEEPKPERPPEPVAERPKGASPEEARSIRERVYQEEIAKGVDPRVAEGRAKAAEIRALKGTKGPGD